MTRRSAALNREHPIPLLEIHPKDAEKLDLQNGSRVRVNSRRGSVPFTLQYSEYMSPGEVSCDFHFHEAPTNILTLADSDPIAHCPEYKCCAVQVEADHD